MKKINSPLIIAAIILILILGVILFPKLFTNKSPYNINKMIFSHEDGKLITTPAPFSPSKDFIFGSDDMGRDIYAYIIYGTRLTILLGVFVALGRFIIALPIALFAGFGNKAAKGVIKVFSVLFSAIPAVLISLIVLKMSFFIKLDRESSIMAFVLVLSLVGWPKISRLIMERVETLNSQPFIKSEVAIGKKRFKIALENVIPHLAPELIVLQLMEIARSLAIIMTLGVFNVFVGNLKYVEDVGEGALNLSNVSFNPEWGRLAFYNVSFEPEWASMLATSRSMLESAPWAVLFPALAFFISILAFNLLGEGLRNAMQKKDSRVIPMMRNLFTFNIAKLWKNSKTSSKIIFFTIVILISSVIFVPYFISANEYSIKEDKNNEISFEEVIIGTQEAQETAEKIAEKMRELGLSPMIENSYYLDYEIEPDVILAAHSVRFFNEDMQISAKLNEDYTFLSAGSFKNDGTLYDATEKDLFNIEDYAKFKKKYILIDKEYYEDSAIEYFISDIQKHVDISGVLLIARQDESVTNFFIQEDKVFTLLLSKEFAQSLKESDDLNVAVSAQIEHLEPKGRNVIGIIGNYDPDTEDKAILIGMNYNLYQGAGSTGFKF